MGEGIKRQISDAVKSAVKDLNIPEGRYTVHRINDPACPFHVERYDCHKDGNMVDIIRIVLGDVSDQDRRLCKQYPIPDSIKKGIMWKKPGARKFKFIWLS